MSSPSHFTTRRSFIVAMGFGGVSLYALWAAYGAAPGPFALLGLGHGNDHEAAGGHGGHGAVHTGTDIETFRRDTLAFIERYRLPDGAVAPRSALTLTTDEHAHGAHAHDTPAVADEAADAADGVIDILLAAGMWYFLPGHLRLEAGRTYRFRMMSLDVSHGASIQFGRGGRMARLRPGRESEMQITFHEPGRYLVYCTVYCGPAHDVMQATIEVV